MKRKPIRINWDDLESAFDDPGRELVYYLDLVDGRVLLEGEGEEDENESYAAAAAAPTPQATTRIAVQQVTTRLKLDWMRRFITESEDLEAGFVEKVNAALDSEDPAPAVIDALGEDPETKDRWYRYRTDRLRDLIDTWLETHEVQTTDTPPWR